MKSSLYAEFLKRYWLYLFLTFFFLPVIGYDALFAQQCNPNIKPDAHTHQAKEDNMLILYI